MMPVATGSVDAIWSSHNLEHLQRHEVPLALREFFTVLKPQGSLLLELPNLRQVAQLIVEYRLEDRAYNSSSGPITPLDMIFGHWRRVTPSWRIAPVLLRGHCKGTCRSRLHRGQPA
jgi:SAM-dependent methyltransferase